MGTKCKWVNGVQVFSGSPQMISATTLDTNKTRANSATVLTVLSETLAAGTFNNTSQSFMIDIMGMMSSSGSEDISIDLLYGSDTILALPTVTLANEDDITFHYKCMGRYASDVLCIANAKVDVYQATADLAFADSTAFAGATVDFTAAGALSVTMKLDAAHVNGEFFVNTAVIQYFD